MSENEEEEDFKELEADNDIDYTAFASEFPCFRCSATCLGRRSALLHIAEKHQKEAFKAFLKSRNLYSKNDCGICESHFGRDTQDSLLHHYALDHRLLCSVMLDEEILRLYPHSCESDIVNKRLGTITISPKAPLIQKRFPKIVEFVSDLLVCPYCELSTGGKTLRDHFHVCRFLEFPFSQRITTKQPRGKKRGGFKSVKILRRLDYRVCPECSKSYGSLGHLREHLVQHYRKELMTILRSYDLWDENMSFCRTCRKDFCGKQLLRHLAVSHGLLKLVLSPGKKAELFRDKLSAEDLSLVVIDLSKP